MMPEPEARNIFEELKKKLIETDKPLPNEVYGTAEYFKGVEDHQNRIFLAQRIRSELAVFEIILGEKRVYKASWE